jgi:acetate kinase
MGGLDVFIFTGGIGENSPEVRKEVCNNLEYMGIKIDPEKNDKNEVSISSPDSKVSVFRIPTNEELVIALDTKNIVEQMTKN